MSLIAQLKADKYFVREVNIYSKQFIGIFMGTATESSIYKKGLRL